MPKRVVRGCSALWLVVAFLFVARGWAADAPAAGVVALHPLATPYGFEAPAPALASVETELVARLTAAGFTVVPSAESGAAWERLMQEVGGFYDPITGDTVAVKYRAVRDGTVLELVARHGTTLWLRPSLEVVVAEWKGGKASWDGASEGVAPVGKGRVPALTLVVAVEDTSGAIVATGRGGIQVLAKVKGSRFVDVPVDKLLADRKRIAKAVRLALEPLVGGKP